MSKITTRDIILASLTGVLYPLSFMVPFLGFTAWALLIPLYWSIAKRTPWGAFKLGLLSGTIANFIGTYWLVGTLTRFGGFPIPVSFVFIIFLSAYAGLAFAIFSYITTRLGLFRKPGYLSVLLIASIWTSIEYLFPFLFPYGITNSQGHYLTIIQMYDLFGIYALSFVIVVVNVALLRIVKRFTLNALLPAPELILSATLIFLALSYGYFRILQVDVDIQNAPKLKVGMVQANFDFLAKTENQEQIVTDKHKEMSEQLSEVDLIIWPETSIQAWFSNDSDYLIVRDEVGVPQMEGKYFIVGGMSFTPKDPESTVITDENLTKYNTAFLTNSDGVILERYHKIKLLLFGEYLPFAQYFPAIKQVSPATGDFTPGDELDLFVIPEKGAKIAPIICYEDIIPSFSRQFVDKGANLIVNITNDAWFGETIAPYQHLLISIPRAVETRKYLLRSTNTGISAIIDPVGRVVAQTGNFVQTNLEGAVALMDGPKTLYTRVGDVFPIAATIFWIGFIAVQKLRGKNLL
ncbi:MAG: apolipoprotein N-acyltransferase [Thermodesulfobacteriota bacterium]